jgi:hypothetical protein
MKKLLALLALLAFLITLPCCAKEVYNDGNYSFDLDNVMIFRNGRELYYTLYVYPLANTKVKDRFYKATITQYTSNGGVRISKIHALDLKGNYIHTDNTKEFIKSKINNYSVVIGNNILATFTNCEDETMYLYCKPTK